MRKKKKGCCPKNTKSSKALSKKTSMKQTLKYQPKSNRKRSGKKR